MTFFTQQPPAPGDPQDDAAVPAATGREGERGQGMVEYAFILILVGIFVLIALQTLGHSTSALYSNITNGMTTASGGGH